MSVANSESAPRSKSKERRWWLLSLLVCLLLFGMVQFWLWNAKQVAEQNLAIATAQLEVRQAIVSQEQDLQQQIVLAKTALTSAQRGLDRAFSSFRHQEMIERLKRQFEKLAPEGVFVAPNNSMSSSWNRSQFIYSPDSTQQLVVYLKEEDDSDNKFNSLHHFETAFEVTDQVFRFSVVGSKLLNFDCVVEKTKTGSRLRIELEGQDPQIIAFDGYRVDGSFDTEQLPSGLYDPNVFQPDYGTRLEKRYEQGLWLVTERGGFTMSHKKSGTRKRVLLVVGLKANRQFRISGDHESVAQKFLDLEWDPEQGNYKSTLKLKAEKNQPPNP